MPMIRHMGDEKNTFSTRLSFRNQSTDLSSHLDSEQNKNHLLHNSILPLWMSCRLCTSHDVRHPTRNFWWLPNRLELLRTMSEFGGLALNLSGGVQNYYNNEGYYRLLCASSKASVCHISTVLNRLLGLRVRKYEKLVVL